MGQHSKYFFEMKLATATKYLEGSCSAESIARSLGTNGTRIVEWVTLYQAQGAGGLKTFPNLAPILPKQNTMPSVITLPTKGH